MNNLPRRLPGEVSDESATALADWIKGVALHAGQVLAVAGGVFLAFGPQPGWPDWWGVGWTFWLGAFLVAIGTIIDFRRVAAYRKLMSERRTSNSRAELRSNSLLEILDAALRLLMDDLSIDFSNARISVYRHKGAEFFLLARVSQSLVLETTGRKRYRDQEGVIGKAWDRGSASVVNLPADRGRWEAACVKDYAMSASDLPSLLMQSRSLAGLRLDTDGGHHVGLVIMESTQPLGVPAAALDELRATKMYPLMREILTEAIQCLDEADVEGYRSQREAAS